MLAALAVNGFTASWVMRWAYLPADHWWQRLAANVSPLAAFLALVPFALGTLGAALLIGDRGVTLRKRPLAAVVLIFAIGVGSVPLAWRLKPGESIRVAGLDRIAAQAQPVIEAIERYRTDHGDYPHLLGALSPKYFSTPPATGNAIFTEFEYRGRGEAWWGWTIPSYELYVRTPVGMLNWDQFIYRPEHEYPYEQNSGSFERIGDWLYLHE